MANRSPEQRLDQSSAASTVADDLASQILGGLAPGSSLPSEAELAERYDVSRLTIREAVKMLEGRRLLESQRGRKAVVRAPDGSAFSDFLISVVRSDPKGLFDLIEVRLSLEVQSATLAAKHANRAAIVSIETALQGMRDAAAKENDSLETELEFHGFDVGFHEAVALAGGNRIMGYLFEAMASPLQEGFQISRRGHERRGHTLQDTVDAHQRILDCIKSGDETGAGEAMRFHLKDTETDIRAALATLAGRRRQ